MALYRGFASFDTKYKTKCYTTPYSYSYYCLSYNMAVMIKGSLYDILMGSVSAGYLMQIVWTESSIPVSTFPF